MSTWDAHAGETGFSAPSLTGAMSAAAGRVAAMVVDAAESLRAWNDTRRARKELWALDDKMLDDIGLTRGQVLRPGFHGWKQY